MAVGFPAGITSAYVVNNTQAKLAALRAALIACEQEYQWSSGLSSADLQAAPVSLDATSAGAILSALADAHALYQVWATGQAPGTYPQVTGTPYVYAASMRVVIGPLT